MTEAVSMYNGLRSMSQAQSIRTASMVQERSRIVSDRTHLCGRSVYLVHVRMLSQVSSLTCIQGFANIFEIVSVLLTCEADQDQPWRCILRWERSFANLQGYAIPSTVVPHAC